MDQAPASATRAERTRETILKAAFLEFYRNSFQGGNLRSVVEAAGITKGALFHHFDGKTALGYAVLDDVIEPLLMERWLDPVVGQDDPITAIQDAFRRYVSADIESGSWMFGCPLNNLAQEMSPLDEGFRSRIDGQYQKWRGAYREALIHGQSSGTVAEGIDVDRVAGLLVTSQMGIWGTGKYSRDEHLMRAAGEAVCDYLETCRA